MRSRRLILITLATGSALFGGSLTFNGSNFSVNQLNTTAGASSNIGEFAVSNTVGLGYINVLDSLNNWLVQNLPVGLESNGTITDRFNIAGSFGRLTTDDLKIDFSLTPLVDATTSSATADAIQHLSVVQTTLQIGGTGPDINEDGVTLPGANVSFNGAAPAIAGTYQTGHPNVEAAVNQCAPAAVANSLKWLGVTTDPNVAGTSADNPNNSLVGRLDAAMGRNLTGCPAASPGVPAGPCGVWPLDGKLTYLGNTGQSGLSVNFQDAGNGAGDAGNGGTLGAGNYTANGVTARNQGAPTFAFIQSEIAAGEDVEIDVQWNCGTVAAPVTCRHYVEVTGAGTILGQQWITHVSDQHQGVAGGNTSVQFNWVNGTNSLPGFGTGAVIDQVISESTPEPGTLALFCLGLLAVSGVRKIRDRMV